MTEVCYENHNKVFVEKGKNSERCFEPCRVKETVAKQRELALERNKINRCEVLVWCVVSYSGYPGLLLFQNMSLLWVMGTFGCPTCHWPPQFSQLNWAPLKCDFRLLWKVPERKPQTGRSSLEHLRTCCQETGLKGITFLALWYVSLLAGWGFCGLYYIWYVVMTSAGSSIWLYYDWLEFVTWLWSGGTSPLPWEDLWIKSSESSRIGEGDLWVWMTVVYMRGRTRIITNQSRIQELIFVTLVKRKLNQEEKILKCS